MSFLRLSFLALIVFLCGPDARAVLSGNGYNTAAPTSTDIANWNTGWGANDITGWDYVGQVNGASGVYVGNGWVLTAGHVGAGTFTLASTSYDPVPGSTQGFSNSQGTADLVMFRLTLSPNLPSLVIASSPPAKFAVNNPGSSVAMIGYGGGQGETWGLNTVTNNNQPTSVSGYSYVTIDFSTAYGTTTAGLSSVTNNAQLVGGDSGGGDFIYNSSTSKWNLAGINEAVAPNHDSYLVQLSSYASQINPITAVPEPETYALLLTGLCLAPLFLRRPRRE